MAGEGASGAGLRAHAAAGPAPRSPFPPEDRSVNQGSTIGLAALLRPTEPGNSHANVTRCTAPNLAAACEHQRHDLAGPARL